MDQANQPWIQVKGERIRIFAALGLTVLFVSIGLWYFSHTSSNSFHTRAFKRLFMNYGSLARISLFFVLAHYVLKWILQKRLADRWNTFKKWISLLSRFARRWHVPVSIIAIGLILLHAAGAFLYGFQFDFHNLSGLLALLVLLPLPVTGLFRYRNMDRKWHLRLGLTFALLFLIHAFL